jgi:hypothetical protein
MNAGRLEMKYPIVSEKSHTRWSAYVPDLLAAWDDEIKKRITELDSGKAKTVPWTEVRQRNLAKLPHAH